MNVLLIIFNIWNFLMIILINFQLIYTMEPETKPKNSNLHFGMYNGNKQGLLRQHKMVGEFLECTYIEHIDSIPNGKHEDKMFKPGTGHDRTLSRVISLEDIDKIENKILSIKCQEKKMKAWIDDISKSLESNLFTVIEISSWRGMINTNKLAGEAGRILSILENKGSNPIGKLREATELFQKYLKKLSDAYSKYKLDEERLNKISSLEEKRINAEIAVITLGKKENSALVDFVKKIRELSNDMRDMKSLIERLFPLVSSESCSNRVMKGLELVQLSFFLLNGINILSVIEEQRMANKFRRDMIRRSLVIQMELEKNTLLKYPKFSEAPNFERVSEFLLQSVIKFVNSEKVNQIKFKFVKNFDSMVPNFGISCPYVLTTILRMSKRNHEHYIESQIFEENSIKNCKLAWEEISSYLYRKGQIIPSAVLRLAMKKAINKHLNTVVSWPRHATELYNKITVDSKFDFFFDTSNEHRFLSTCIDALQGEIGINTIHGISLDEIIIICFNFYNSLEVYTENYNYGNQNKSEKGKQIFRATTNNVTIRTLPSNIRAKALDVSISYSIPGIIDHPPFRPNDLDRVVIGILPENFLETCTRRVESVFGPATKYRIGNSFTICQEVIDILKDYNILTQNSKINKNNIDIFEMFKIMDITYLPSNSKSNLTDLDVWGYLKILQGELKNMHFESQHSANKEGNISPLNQLDTAKTYHLIRSMHLEWMDQMKNDPRFKGLTELELKNNSPWKKQLNLWHALITPNLPEIRYAATYTNNRPSRFPLLPGDRRGKSKKIIPLEDLINKEIIEPRYRARYALLENEHSFYHSGMDNSVSTDPYYKNKESILDKAYLERKVYLRNKIDNKDKGYLINKNVDYISSKDYYKKISSYIKNNHNNVGTEEFRNKGNGFIVKNSTIRKPKILAKEFKIKNGCSEEEMPVNWSQRAIILYENMNNLFKKVKYETSYGPGHFVSISDICYILERDFKVKKNYFEDISKVTLTDCYKWFKEYLAKLWPPFNLESLQNDVKSLCWKSGFKGWL